MFVPSIKRNDLISNLLNSRCLFETNKDWIWNYEQCPYSVSMGGKCEEHWHQQNMCEIHHTELRSSRSSKSQKEISFNWIKYLLENNKRKHDEVYFNILYLDLDILEIDNFGTQKIHENIYNKFFRTAISYGIKAFFGNKKVKIKKIYHDEGSMKHHSYFPCLNLIRLDSDLGINVMIEDTNVAFVDSDHRNYLNKNNDLMEASQLIQFIDLLIGSITQNIYYLSEDKLKNEVAMILRPLVEKLLKEPNNKNSSFNYFGRQHIGFFPSQYIENAIDVLTTLSQGETEKYKKGLFYSNKKMEMPSYCPQQKSLSFFMDGQ